MPALIPRHSATLFWPRAAARGCERLLVVGGNEPLRRALVEALVTHASETRTAASVAEVRMLIAVWYPDAVVLDCELPDGTGFDVLRAIIETGPMPDVVAIGDATATGESFQLAQMGVRAFVSKPIASEAIERTFDAAMGAAPDPTPLVRMLVGRLGMREVEENVRAIMVAEALVRAHGNRKIAARLLSISRQLLQHILRKSE